MSFNRRGYIRTAFSFDLGTIDGGFLAEVMSTQVAFEARWIDTPAIGRGARRYRPAKHLALIAGTQKLDSLTLSTHREETGECFDFDVVADSFEGLYWEQRTCPDLDWLHSLTARPGFNTGHAVDSDYVTWQSEKRLSNLELFGESTEGMARVWDEDFGRWDIDTLQNPGARHLFPGGWLVAAWRMWFGGGIFRHLPRDRLLAFKEAERVEEFDTGAVFIELYPEAADCNTPDARERQRRFREWMNIPELARRAEDLLEVEPDPTMEIEVGEFEHGGARRITHWLNDRGEPVRQSRATRKRVEEYSLEQGMLWSEETDV